MDKQTKSFVKDMEYLVKLLHKEWERSGKRSAEVMLRPEDMEELEKRAAKEVHTKQKQLEHQGLTFKESMRLSKQNFILLRMVKRVRKAEEKAKKTPPVHAFTVELDREEYKLFKDIMDIREG